MIKRGITPGDLEEFSSRAQQRFNDVWVRWLLRSRLGSILRHPVACFVDNEILRYWHWIWPVWIGPYVGIHLREMRRVVDDRWRR